MAFREVVLTEEEQKAGGGRQWAKFAAIGDSALGFFVRKETQKKTFKVEEGEKTIELWIFYGKLPGRPSPEEFEVIPTHDLKMKLEKAEREFGLKEGLGHLVKMTFSSTRKIDGRDEPMKIFTVATDVEFQPKTPLPASVTWFRQRGAEKSPANPPYNPDVDIPF